MMPGRLELLVTGEIYHVFNRGIDRRPVFTSIKEYDRAYKTISYYRFARPPVKLARFLALREELRDELMRNLEMSFDKLIKIYSFCLMPNHFHFLIRQEIDGGISKFLSNFQNSYTRYFNVRNERTGSLLMDQFKTVRIETNEQLVHISRYIHLNPYTGYVIKTMEELENYPWSSLSNYLGLRKSEIIDTELVMSSFKDVDTYREFILDQAEYQRELKAIEHLIIEQLSPGVRYKPPPRWNLV